jgi:ATP-dependent Clp protease adapter protein ClpS
VPPTTLPATVGEEEIATKIGEIFDDHYAVIIMDSDYTTFGQVEGACVVLFGYTAEEAAALAVKVHTTGEALAAVLPQPQARRAVRSLRSRNVRARAEPA